ncbi:uncharacterized protein JN550_007377 [Neoarthrinium moseri]|uniref:uncharacterized protein n=1 Tax=Neoarthrinium moseri TaxID=1658444 RepID=UPI001FDD1920|nr:uncharacterized protein JN550_007377 [Neoarthrinium moseri]KAI1866830.1 hypothetical protein JN550_007377 [Neoarthrinium moseri]
MAHPARPLPRRPTSPQASAQDFRQSIWQLDGFLFAYDDDPMICNADIRKVLEEPTFMPGKRIRENDEHLRFRTNLRVIFEAANHFELYSMAKNFWSRLSDTLQFSPAVSPWNLKDVVNAYCAGREAYCRAKHIRGERQPDFDSTNRLAALADSLARRPKPNGFIVSEARWTPLESTWGHEKGRIFADLGVHYNQLRTGRCAPELRSDAPHSLASRITESQSYRPSHSEPRRDSRGYDTPTSVSRSPDDLGPGFFKPDPTRELQIKGLAQHEGQTSSTVSVNHDRRQGSARLSDTGSKKHTGDPLPPQPSLSGVSPIQSAEKPATSEARQDQNGVNSRKRTHSDAVGEERPSLERNNSGNIAQQGSRAPDTSAPTAEADASSKRPCLEGPELTSPLPETIIGHNAVAKKGSKAAAVTPSVSSNLGPIHENQLDENTEYEKGKPREELRNDDAPMEINSTENNTPAPRPELLEAACTSIHSDQARSMNPSSQQSNISVTLGGQRGETIPAARLPASQQMESHTESIILQKDHEQERGSTDAVRDLLISLEKRQKRLEEIETSMQAWQAKLNKRASDQEQIEKLETRVQLLTDQLAGYEHKQVEEFALVGKGFKGLRDQLSINKQRVDHLEAGIRNLEQNPAHGDTDGRRIDHFESRVKDLERYRSIDKERLETTYSLTRDHSVKIGQVREIQSKITLATNHINRLETRFINQQNLVQTEVNIAEEVRRTHSNRLNLLDTFAKDIQDQVRGLNKAQTAPVDRIGPVESIVKELQEVVTKRSAEFDIAMKGVQDQQESEIKRVDSVEVQLKKLQQSSTSHHTEQHIPGTLMALVHELQEKVNQPCPESSRMDAVEKAFKGIEEKSKNKISDKRFETVEKTVKELKSQLGQNAMKKRMDTLESDLKGAMAKILQQASKERVDGIETLVNELKTEITNYMSQDQTSRASDSVTAELCDVRDYVDRSLTMTSMANQKRLLEFQEVLDGMQDKLTQRSENTSHNAAIESQLADLGKQLDELRERSAFRNETPRRLLSPSISDLESLTGQPETKTFLDGVVSEMRKLRGVLKNRIQDLDASGAPDDDKKLAISDISYELAKVIRYTNKLTKDL